MLAFARTAYDFGRDRLRRINPSYRRAAAAQREIRRSVENRLATMARNSSRAMGGRILIDAIFDNPNYWFRVSLARAALGTVHGQEVGILGSHNFEKCLATLNRLGISQIDTVTEASPRRFRSAARSLLAEVKTADDLLELKLPHGLPAATLYDMVQKRQRAAVVNVRDPMLVDYTAECLSALAAADRILMQPTSLVLLSHAYGLPNVALAWIATRRGVPVVGLGGMYGGARFARILKPEDIYRVTNRPNSLELDRTDSEIALRLRAAAQTYLR